MHFTILLYYNGSTLNKNKDFVKKKKNEINQIDFYSVHTYKYMCAQRTQLKTNNNHFS